MYRTMLVSGALIAALAAPAAAQTSTTTTTTGTSGSSEFYVVQDVATKKCTIVDKKPTTTSMVQVGPVAFKSRAEAETGMSSVKVCTSN